MNKQTKFKLQSTQLIPLSFLAAILIGTVLLLLPVAKAGEGSASFTTAFFSFFFRTIAFTAVTFRTGTFFTAFASAVLFTLACTIAF